jgi:hypothetical protein
MSLALTHFAVGAGLMQLLLVIPRSSIRVRYRESLVVASGMWALVPDLHYVSPVLRGSLSGLKFTVFGNLFWFHAFLDSLHQGEGTRAGAALAVGFLLVSTAVSEWIRATRRDREADSR